MKFFTSARQKVLWILCIPCVLCGFVLKCSALDREAFTFTTYDLTAQVDPGQHRLAVRGKVTLRNDSQTPQKIGVLQISSSLDWRTIKAGDKPVQFVTQTYTSDIDHTGALSEAIVTLPEAVAPKGTVDLDVAYEGVVVLDATRLTRIGTPDDMADSSDWDQIDAKFTAVRGVGYVAWYPIATEFGNISEESSLSEVLGRWRAREAGASVHIKIGVTVHVPQSYPADLVISEPSCQVSQEAAASTQLTNADCNFGLGGLASPTFLVANYELLSRSSLEVHYLPGHDVAATNYADAEDKLVPFITDWFGKPREKPRTADLPNSDAAPFEGGSLLMTPLASVDPKLPGLAAAHQLTHAAFSSPRPWINEGLAHFAQALYLEDQKGRQTALDYMGVHRVAFREAEPATTAPRSEDEVKHSLVNTTNDELYRSKAMCVWWMLRDMLGAPALKKALAAYRPEQDREPSYMPRLIQAQTQRDLEWFFDDWVYRDRGLPDFKVASAFSRKTMSDAYLLTITVENLGSAGAEVPVTVKFAGGEISKRLEVHGKDKAVLRLEVNGPPQQVIVNDGSVPESDMTNKTFKIETPDAGK